MSLLTVHPSLDITHLACTRPSFHCPVISPLCLSAKNLGVRGPLLPCKNYQECAAAPYDAYSFFRLDMLIGRFLRRSPWPFGFGMRFWQRFSTERTKSLRALHPGTSVMGSAVSSLKASRP